MKSEVLRKIRKKRQRRRIVLMIIVALAVASAVAGYYIYKDFSLEAVEVQGNYTYQTEEVVEAVQKRDYVPNTLLMTLQNRIFHQTYLPFVKSVRMSCKKHHILTVRLEEKMRAGVFEYKNRYYYFNESGVLMESRKTLFENVPVVTGVSFEEVKPNEKIKVKGDYFETIVQITKLIISYGLQVSEIHFDGENDITLVSGAYKIHIGSTDQLQEKIENIPAVLESVGQKESSGTVDMSLYTDEKRIITFSK